MGKFLKWTFAILFFLVGLGGFLNMLQTERGPSTPERLMLTSTGSNVVEVAADKTTFKLLAEIGAAYNYIHSIPNSKEDQRELARSQQLVTYLLDVKAETLSRKKGLIVDLPLYTPCEEIQRLRFSSSRLFPGEFIGVQIRIADGPHKGFEGWVFPDWVTTAR